MNQIQPILNSYENLTNKQQSNRNQNENGALDKQNIGQSNTTKPSLSNKEFDLIKDQQNERVGIKSQERLSCEPYNKAISDSQLRQQPQKDKVKFQCQYKNADNHQIQYQRGQDELYSFFIEAPSKGVQSKPNRTNSLSNLEIKQGLSIKNLQDQEQIQLQEFQPKLFQKNKQINMQDHKANSTTLLNDTQSMNFAQNSISSYINNRANLQLQNFQSNDLQLKSESNKQQKDLNKENIIQNTTESHDIKQKTINIFKDEQSNKQPLAKSGYMQKIYSKIKNSKQSNDSNELQPKSLDCLHPQQGINSNTSISQLLNNKGDSNQFAVKQLWSTYSLKIRSMIPEAIGCHHVWWIIHFIVNAILLWKYFSQSLNITAGTLAVIELLIGVSFRNEIIIIILHVLVALIPIGKRFFNRMVHCLGGIHTSAAISVVIWLIIFLAKEARGLNTIIIGSVLLTLVVIISLAAIPPVRKKYHNSFELMHRFTGWTAVIVLVALVVSVQVDSENISVQQAFKSVSVLVTIFIVVVIFLPWVFVYKSKVSWEQPSPLLGIAKFSGVYFPYGRTSRISLNGIEWHAFAIALVDAGKNEHALVIAKAGDWTANICDGCTKSSLPNRIWVRKLKSMGFMYSVHAYKRVLIVCTGGGIAPALAYIQNPIPATHIHVLWIAKKHLEIYGEFIVGLVEKLHPNYTLYDTNQHGRPKIELVEQWFYKVNAEAVFVVSNKIFTDQIVNGLWVKGISSFGALFDS